MYHGRDPAEPLLGVKGMNPEGGVEDPRSDATIEIGRKASNLMVDGIISKARELLATVQAGARPG